MDNITAKATEHGGYDYSYDELYRLTGADNPVQSDEGFTYDAVGNRLTAAGVADNWSYNDNNELQGYAGITFEYDANGNMTKKTDAGQVTYYIYNVEDRLTEVWNGAVGTGSLISNYYYDPFGRRLWKEVAGVRTYFVYADEGVVAEVDAAGNVIKSYGYRPGSTWSTDPLFMKVGTEYYFYQNDHLGTPQKLTAVNGAVVWSAKYSSFGKTYVAPSSTITNNLRFPGQYFDSETGLHYNMYRYYDPATGRYLRADPIGFEGGINLFSYVDSNPIKYFDQTGLKNFNQLVNPPIHDPNLGAPGDSEPRQGMAQFTGSSYEELWRFTMQHYSVQMASHLTQSYRRLVIEEEFKIPCNRQVKYKFCFTINSTGVNTKFLIKPGTPYWSRIDTKCVTTTIRGRKNCNIECEDQNNLRYEDAN